MIVRANQLAWFSEINGRNWGSWLSSERHLVSGGCVLGGSVPDSEGGDRARKCSAQLVPIITYWIFFRDGFIATCLVSNRAGHLSQLLPARSGEVWLCMSCGSMLNRSRPDIGGIERDGGVSIERGLIECGWLTRGAASERCCEVMRARLLNCIAWSDCFSRRRMIDAMWVLLTSLPQRAAKCSAIWLNVISELKNVVKYRFMSFG